MDHFTLCESAYSDYFFCSNCKLNEDACSSGLNRRIDRNSKRFRCTANHIDFCFPTQCLIAVEQVEPARAVSSINDTIDEESCSGFDEEHLDVSHSSRNLCGTCLVEEDSSLHVAFETLAQAYYGIEEKVLHLSRNDERESKLSSKYERDIEELKSVVLEQKESMKHVRERLHSLVTSVEYYKKRLAEVESRKLPKTSTLEEAVVASVNLLLESTHQYKLLLNEKKAIAIAKAVFHDNFGGGLAF